MTTTTRTLTRVVLLAEVAIAIAGCADTPRVVGDARRAAITIVVSGDERSVTEVRAAAAAPMALPLDVRLETVPNVVAPRVATAAIESTLAAARGAYARDADFAACQRAISGETLIRDLLASGRRDLAARALFWRVACHVGAGETDEALRVAREFATLGLETPPDIEAASPEVDATISRALREIEAAPRNPLRVSANVARAAVSVDGRAELCVAPCTVDLPPGDHVVRVESDGAQPEVHVVRVTQVASDLAVRTTPAPPMLAAQQWTARYARSPAIDAAPSMSLLASAVRAQRLVLLTAERESGGVRLRGVLAADGAVTARAERATSSGRPLASASVDLLTELLVRGAVLVPPPALYARPLFWGSLAGVALIAAGVSVAILFPREIATTVVLGREPAP